MALTTVRIPWRDMADLARRMPGTWTKARKVRTAIREWLRMSPNPENARRPSIPNSPPTLSVTPERATETDSDPPAPSSEP